MHAPRQPRGHSYSRLLVKFLLPSLPIVLIGICAIAQSSRFVTVPGATWATRFDGPARDTERRPVMTLDTHGNVFVAAETKSLTASAEFPSTPDLDIVTVKYDNNGQQQWADVFDGEGNFIDSPHDIGVDAQGNVFVTGYTWRGRNTQAGTEYDFVTIKYGTNGKREWVRYYTGPQQRSETDQAFFLELDAAGNVYVTGMAFYNGWDNRLAGQIVTIKYDTNGNDLWVRGYTGADQAGSMPQAFHVDDNGNVYLAGQVRRYDPVSNTFDSDHLLLKYGTNGNLLSATRHDTPGPNSNDEDYVDYMHLDREGNIYVLGRTFPNQQWPDNDTGRDMILIKFTNGGSLIWERTWVTPGDNEFKTFEEIGDEIVSDGGGNVYVSGHTDDRNLFWAIITVKFDSDGKELWHDIYDPGPGDADWPAGIEIAPDGQAVYVGATARNEQDQSHYDVTIIRYTAAGARTITRYDGHPAAEVFGPIGANRNVMDIDGAGNLYLVGEAQNDGLRPDLLIEKIGNTPLATPSPTPTPTPSPSPSSTPTPSPPPNPLELLLDTSDPFRRQAVALDSILFLRDPFPLLGNTGSFNLADQNTRVIIFVRKLSLLAGETPALVIVSLTDSSGRTSDVAAEDVRGLAGLDFVQVVFKLPGALPSGTYEIKVRAHSLVSNTGTIRIK